jgi:hypothetical protein
MNRVPPSNTGPRINFDRRWTYEVAYFTQYIGAILRDLGNFLNSRDYVEARLLAAQMKKRAEYEKTIQPKFKTSDYFAKARKLFNSFLDECVHFAELLRVTTIQEETGCEELLEKQDLIQNSIDRLNLLKEMFTDELGLQGWHQY